MPQVKQSVLSRYERDAHGDIIIDVSAQRIEDLYNNFDKNAPYVRRDLDQDFADYLVACAREVGKAPFIIILTLAKLPDEPGVSRIQSSLKTYYNYLAESTRENILQMFRRSTIFLAIGLSILFASVWLNELLGAERSVTANVFAEGLTIAAWVSLWEALAVILIEWFPHRKNVLLYRRLAVARLVLRSKADVAADSDKGTIKADNGNII